MYDFVDRRVTTLDHGGRFLIWSMRSWAVALRDGRCPCSVIGPAFSKWRMVPGLAPFHAMMLGFNRAATEDFIFAPLGCLRIHEHEALVLSLIRTIGVEGEEAGRATLELLVREAAVAPTAEAIVKVGRAMVEARIFPGRPNIHRQPEGGR